MILKNEKVKEPDRVRERERERERERTTGSFMKTSPPKHPVHYGFLK
jgi:hypothetical protein